ncbi:MAG: type I methionyl aminopeptidase [Acidobacteriota bacterium]|nr:MAG: type I methionyl aminopeptidase [Acidobacteriota bacterium]
MARRSSEEIAKIDRACQVVRQILRELDERVAEGVSTAELDAYAERRARQMEARPAFKGYMGYPASLCTSINEEIVHGIPGERRLRSGDMISLDFGVLLDGYYGDGAITCPVGEVSAEDDRLSRVTLECLRLAVEEVQPGRRISDIGHAVEQHATAAGFSVVREFVGHAIGTRLHEEPQVPNFGAPGRGPRIEEGMVLAIEPMITAGNSGVRVLEDGWTAVTRDGSRAAHWELVVAAMKNGPLVLGGPDGSAKL